MTPVMITSASKATPEDFVRCRDYTRHHAKTFYFASHVLPRAKRRAAYALYSFCRQADDLVDNPEAVADPAAASRQLLLLRGQLDRVYSGEAIGDPKLRAFQTTVFTYDIPQEYFRDLLRGVEMDLMKTTYQNYAELEEYCYCVASTVGLMMTKIFGATNEQSALAHAAELGKAMQLTNILRDVGEDHRRGRTYLPADEMEHFGVTHGDIIRGAVTPQFVELMKFQIERATALYRNADAGIPQLTDDGSRFCVVLMSRTYAEILPAIAANGYDTLSTRAYVPLSRKFRIAVGAYLGKPPRRGRRPTASRQAAIPMVHGFHPQESSHVL